MGKTSVEWTDESWPIVNGCRRKSPGCEENAKPLPPLPPIAGEDLALAWPDEDAP